MKNIKLESIVLRNFKGIKLFEGTFPGKESFIRGENATGKSSILDGVSWVIDGKNAAGESDAKFSIKTLDANNNAIPKLQHSVEAVFEIDGMKRILKRVYSEKYTKKSGSENSEFTGHTTNFFIDGIEHNESLYKKKVSEIIGASLEEYLMLSSPLYFINRMDWKGRRKILSDMAGDVSYSDIMVNKKFEELEIELKKYSPEEYKAHCDKTKKVINKSIEGIPLRFDELDKMEAELSKIDFPGIEKKIAEINDNIQENEDQIRTATDSGVAESITLKYTKLSNTLKQELANAENDKLDLQSKKNNKIAEGSKNLENEIAETKSILNTEKGKLATIEGQLSSTEERSAKSCKELAALILNRDELRASGSAIIAREFKLQQENCCPACKRAFSDKDLAEKEVASRAHFEQLKKNDLAELTVAGKAASAIIEKIDKDVEIQTNQMDSLIKESKIQTEAVDFIQDKLNSLTEKLSLTIIDTTEIDRAITVVDTLITTINDNIKKTGIAGREKLAEIDDNSSKKIKAELQLSIKAFKDDVVELNKTLSSRGQLDTIKIQKNKLSAEEKDLAKSWDKWARQLFLVEELIKDYVSKIEESVNKKFSLVKFKLFEIQQNGGIKPTCLVLLDGVPDGDINTAGTLNAGLDVINTLSKHFNVTAPITIDNRESITDIIKTDSQIINLVKDSDYKELTQTDK